MVIVISPDWFDPTWMYVYLNAVICLCVVLILLALLRRRAGGPDVLVIECSDCDGSGEVETGNCPTCYGHGCLYF